MNARGIAWERGLAALRRYAAIKGTAGIPIRAQADGVDVGAWVDSQRAQYWAGALQPQCAATLERLPGWDWGGRHQRKWHDRLAALSRYAHAGQIPANATVNRLRIGAWAAAQRAAYAAGTLPARNAALLETIPGWTWKTDHNQHGPPLTKLRPAANGGSLLGLAGSVTGGLDAMPLSLS